MNQPPEDLFWSLLSKKLAGEATDAELRQLTEISSQFPDLMYAAQHLQDLWQLQPQQDTNYAEEMFDQVWDKINKHEPAPDAGLPPLRRRSAWKPLAVFAGAVLLVLYGFLLFESKQQQHKLAHQPVREVLTGNGSKTRLVLPDSSVVWLNGGSKLNYGSEFGKQVRQVQLIGEAYFEVTKSSIPFIVKANNVNIKVLGTAFNVRSYAGEATETSLIHGRVEVTIDKRPDEKYILKPNEKIVIKDPVAEQQTVHVAQPIVVLTNLTVTKDNLIPETSWIDNKLVFENETFEVLASKMEHWFGVAITFQDEQLKSARFTGVFKNETIVEALEALQFTTGFQFKINGSQVTIEKKN